mgnify:FL=1
MLKTKKNIKQKGGKLNNAKWNNILKYSVLPTMIKKGGDIKSKKNRLSKKIGLKKTNNLLKKSLKGGFIRGGSTQFFPVNCTNLNTNNINQLQGYEKQLFSTF